jgi:molecular chaperone IbpA
MTLPFERNLLLNTVGFDRLLDVFSDLENTKTDGKYPPYNIIREAEHDYAVEIAVAGFKRDELEITFDNGKLTVTGSVKAQRGGQYLHRGVATRDFTHQFRLSDTMVVKGADIEDGMLVIRLQNVIPEEKRPRRINIGGASESVVGLAGKAA